MKDEAKKIRLFTRRAFIVGCFKGAILLTVLGRFSYLQIMHKDKYQTISKRNRIRITPIIPNRGRILDRNGQVLASEVNKFHLTSRKDIKNSQLNEQISEEQDALLRLILDEESLISQNGTYVLSELNWEIISKLESHRHNLPQFEFSSIPTRIYPFKNLISHILGYVGQPSNADERGGNVLNQWYIGKVGIEKFYNNQLQGILGVREIEVNAKEQFIRELKLQKSIAGEDLKLAIDIRLQELARDVCQDQAAIVIITDLDKAEIICMYSYPNYDPNKFITGFSHQEWNELQTNPHTPLLNRAISSRYPPGSIFKIVTALAALDFGIDPKERVFCTGKHRVGNRDFHCWNRLGHGSVNLLESMAVSCNVYFYNMVQRFGIRKLYEVASKLNLHKRTEIDLPNEIESLIPNKSWKQKVKKESWLLGDSINSSIGQGFLAMTPIAMNNLVGQVAAGRLLKPSLVQGKGMVMQELSFPKSHLDLVREGLYMSGNHHTGTIYRFRTRIPGFELCGKTGTAQVVSLNSKNKIDDHSIFGGFAPYNNPKYSITVLIEHGTWGSKAAAPAAAKLAAGLYDLYYRSIS